MAGPKHTQERAPLASNRSRQPANNGLCQREPRGQHMGNMDTPGLPWKVETWTKTRSLPLATAPSANHADNTRETCARPHSYVYTPHAKPGPSKKKSPSASALGAHHLRICGRLARAVSPMETEPRPWTGTKKKTACEGLGQTCRPITFPFLEVRTPMAFSYLGRNKNAACEGLGFHFSNPQTPNSQTSVG